MEEKSNDKDKDAGASKLQRLLSSHSLQGLVYQKRQRKQTHTVNPFTQLNLKSPQPPKKKIVKLEKQKSKKIVKAQKKQQKAQNKSPSKPKSKGKQKEIKKQVKKNEKQKKQDQNTKKRGRPKKLSKQQQPEKQEENDIGNENNQQIGEKQKDEGKEQIQRIKQQQEQLQQQQQMEEQQQNIPQQSEEEQQEQQQYQQNIKSKNIKSIARNLKQKQKQIQKQKQKQRLQSVEEKQKLNDVNVNKQPQQLINNIVQNNNQPQDNTIVVMPNNEEVKQPENQLQTKKKIYGRHKKSGNVNIDMKSIKNDPQKNEQIVVQQNQKIQQEQEQQKQKQKQKSNQVQRTLRIRRRFNPNDTGEINDQKKQQEHQSEKQCSNPRKRRLRLRKTKDEALKKFNMFEGFSQEQQNQNYQIRKRKGISDKQYQINRIFRKTQRVNLPNVKLDVDIMTFSMQNFISRFKSFDLIHCSLPLDMLIRLPSIGSLINKGFIFIWVEKGEIQIGYHWLSRIGFDVIDQIMWVKTNETVSQVKCDINSQNQIFPNCRSTCLVGYKCSSNQKTEYCTKISNNLIFSPDRPATIQKPDEIYQIGDLMMPGARKLQIGFKELGGWFTLKHIQNGLIRCYQCLRRCKNQLFFMGDKSVLCKYCIQNKKDKQNKEQQLNQGKQQVKKKQNEQKYYPLNIQVKKYEQYPQIECQDCKKTVTQAILLKQNIEQTGAQQIFYCKDCYTLLEQIEQITVFNRQQVYFPKKYITCTNCNKMCLHKYYFQCSSCKNDHNICSKCFYQSNPPKTQPENQNQNQNQIQKEQKVIQQKNDIKTHDWKLKFLYEQPDTRVACFECSQQCAIPYWGCQTCQSWYWCGKCKSTQIPKAHQHHCHYNRQHHLHLII